MSKVEKTVHELALESTIEMKDIEINRLKLALWRERYNRAAENIDKYEAWLKQHTEVQPTAIVY